MTSPTTIMTGEIHTDFRTVDITVRNLNLPNIDGVQYEIEIVDSYATDEPDEDFTYELGEVHSDDLDGHEFDPRKALEDYVDNWLGAARWSRK